MDAIKARFIEVHGECEFGGTSSVSQAPYYVADLRDNLVIPMSPEHRSEYSQGSGNELDSKMKSLRSSSAMTFNLLGADPVTIRENPIIPAGEYDVTFEYQLPTLASNPNPANLDALLVSGDGETEVYCEMKMAEWILGKAGGLRPAYLDPASYLIPNDAATAYVSVFQSLCADNALSGERIAPKLLRYDAFQMLKHLLAIYSGLIGRFNKDESLPTNVLLVNCVWELENPNVLGKHANKYRQRLSEEHEQYALFAERAKPLTEAFLNLGVNFQLAYMSFREFASCLVLSPDHAQGIQRYLV